MAKLTAVPTEEPEEGARAPFFDDDDLAETLAQDYTAPVEGQSEPPAPEPIQFHPDMQALADSHGDGAVWAAQLADMISAITGSTFDPSSLQWWFDNHAVQQRQLAFREALFQVANTALPSHTREDGALLLLQLRNEIAAGFRAQAGMLS